MKKLLLICGMCWPVLTFGQDLRVGNMFVNIYTNRPPSLPQPMRLWLKADGITAANGQAITNWTDYSGLGNHAFQTAGSTNCPTYTNGMVNGQPAIYFNGTNAQSFDLTIANTFAGTEVGAEYFVAVRVKADPATGNRTGLVWFGGAATTTYPQGGGSIIEGFAMTSSATGVDPTPSLTLWHLYNFSVTTNGGQLATYRLDGATLGIDTSLAFTPNGGTGPRAVGRSQGTSVTAWLDGYIAEILVYGRVLTDAERDIVEVYFANKYGLTIN